jgi:immune inhibitor A
MPRIRPHSIDTPCFVAPHPDVLAQLRAQLGEARASVAGSATESLLAFRTPRIFGLDDGTILPPEEFALGTKSAVIRAAAAARTPLRGNLNVLVVLVQFPDRAIVRPQAEYEALFFGRGTNSVHDFYSEASGGLVGITGRVVGPFTMPRPLAEYANGAMGKGPIPPNAQTMAFDAAQAALANVDASLDNDGNGFVDGFIIVHAGRGAEETNDNNDIWSHKAVLPARNGLAAADGTRVFAYLTVPEDTRLGTCAHELGHLLFGWPDLYDTDFTSNGIGNWCVMSYGNWNGPDAGAAQGDVPAHPSAWCKATQGWVNVVVQNHNEQVAIADVQSGRTVYRLWKDGVPGPEYFLVENRQRNGFDRALPADGLLIWHIDESVEMNTNEDHYKVALMQADGRRDLERNRSDFGDDGDPFPGTAQNATFDGQSTPSSQSYQGLPTSVAVTAIPASAASMPVQFRVTNVPPHHHAVVPPH